MGRDYHKYLYDHSSGTIVGDYETAYANCDDVHPEQHDVARLKLRIVRDILMEKTPCRILDVGCGYGDFVAHMSSQDMQKAGVSICGCDVSPSAIKAGQCRFPDAELTVADIAKGLPHADNEFDALLLFGVLWFLLGDLETVLDEVSRVLKPGGMFACSLCFPPNQKFGKEVIGSFEDLRAALSSRFTLRQFAIIHEPAQLAEGLPLAQCQRDCFVIAENTSPQGKTQKG